MIEWHGGYTQRRFPRSISLHVSARKDPRGLLSAVADSMTLATGRAIYLGEGLARSGFVVLALVGGTPTLVGCSTPPAPIHVSDPIYWPTAEWRKSAPEAQGLDSEKLAAMLDAVRTRGIPIHSLQVIRNGYLALDTYFYPYNSHDLHDTASVTKSVTATLVGIAVAQGLVPSVTTPLLSMFPGRAIASRTGRSSS